LFSGERDCDSADLDGFRCLACSDEVSGQLKSFVTRYCEVEFSECLFDYGDPESPVPVKRAIKIEDDAL